MSVEQIFRRFQDLLKEQHNIPSEKILDIWNKNGFCTRVLEAGCRKGNMCEKKCVKNYLYCRDHVKYSKTDL